MSNENSGIRYSSAVNRAQTSAVRRSPFSPFTFAANRNRGMFSARLESHSGTPPSKSPPVTSFITIDNPETPPVTSPSGSNRFFVAKAIISVPNRKRI